jgi:hypothetical protein
MEVEGEGACWVVEIEVEGTVQRTFGWLVVVEGTLVSLPTCAEDDGNGDGRAARKPASWGTVARTSTAIVQTAILDVCS